MRQLREIEGERGLDKIFAESGKVGIWSCCCQRLKPFFFRVDSPRLKACPDTNRESRCLSSG
jgi:hypothetical protein